MKPSSNNRNSQFLVIILLLHCAFYSMARQTKCVTYYTQPSAEEVLPIKIGNLRKAKLAKKSFIQRLSNLIKGDSVKSEVSLKELETILNGNLQYEIDGVTIYYTVKDPFVNPPIAEKTEHFNFFLGENLKLAEFLEGINLQNGKIEKIEIFEVNENAVYGATRGIDAHKIYRKNHLFQAYQADRNGVKHKAAYESTVSPKYLKWFKSLPSISAAEVLSKYDGTPISVAARVASTELLHVSEYVEGLIHEIDGQLQLVPTIGNPIIIGKNNIILDLKFKSANSDEVKTFGSKRFHAIVEMFRPRDSHPDYLVTIPEKPSSIFAKILRTDLAEGVLDGKLVLLNLKSTKYFPTGLIEVGESFLPTGNGKNLKPSSVKIDQIEEDGIVLNTEIGKITIPWFEIKYISIAGEKRSYWGTAKHSFPY